MHNIHPRTLCHFSKSVFTTISYYFGLLFSIDEGVNHHVHVHDDARDDGHGHDIALLVILSHLPLLE